MLRLRSTRLNMKIIGTCVPSFFCMLYRAWVYMLHIHMHTHTEKRQQLPATNVGVSRSTFKSEVLSHNAKSDDAKSTRPRS